MSNNDYVLSFVMAGGRGSRLFILTRDRSKPAVNILGHYRIFDFVATNIANSDIPAMLVATQFEPGSLAGHIRDGEIWDFDGIDKKIEIVHPYETGRNLVMFEGTADSVRKNMERIERYHPSIVLVLGGDHIYAMRYTEFIKQHKKNKAEITIMVQPVSEDRVSNFGLLEINKDGRIIDFVEKPRDKATIEKFRLTPAIKNHLGITNPGLDFLASMGNYVFFTDRLKKFLDFPGSDFGRDIIPAMIKQNGGNLFVYVFQGYWRDVGKIQDYFSCSMEFASENPPIDLVRYRVRTYNRQLPGACLVDGVKIHNAILSPGDIIYRGSIITHSVLGYQVVVEKDCNIDYCIFLGADRNEFYRNQVRREYTARIGEGSVLSHVILDKNVWVGKNVNIGPRNGNPEERKELLQRWGLKPYQEFEDGRVEGDFYIDPETGILVVGKQNESDPKEPILPDGLKA